MLKIIVFTTFLMNIWVSVDAAVGILPPQEKPAEYKYEEGCWNPEIPKMLKVNEPYSPQNGSQCIQYTCETDGYTYIYTCGVIGVGEGCYIVPGDLYKPYPDCCNNISCTPTTVKPPISKCPNYSPPIDDSIRPPKCVGYPSETPPKKPKKPKIPRCPTYPPPRD